MILLTKRCTEKNCMISTLKELIQTNLPLLNEQQKYVFDTLMKVTNDETGGIYFVDAPGGTGKTFLISLILATIRSQNKISLALASSGIVATLLEDSNIYVSDETLCQSCNFREHRLRQIDNIYKSDLSSADNRDNFMKGDNPINGILSKETLNKRKNRLMEISNYNYNTAKELINAIENEKKKNRTKKNNDNYFLKKRPSSITNIEKRVNFKHSLLDQIECNKIKKETEKMATLKREKMMQNELLKSLYDERIRNIEARNRSKKDYLIILDEHLKNKTKITEEQKKKDKKIPSTKTFIFGPDQTKLQKLNNW
ncbi:hypothetical protein QTP88_023320 [Uroleucon formosanum]